MKTVLVVDDAPEVAALIKAKLAAALAQNETTRRTPGIFLSSLVTPQDAKQGSAAGKWPMLSKQGPIEFLITKIDELLVSGE